jgi:cytidyltransferase-like protein
MVNRVVLCTGGFDPLHSGHIEYFRAARRLGDVLVVGVNSDSWLRRKKGREFMPSYERIKIIESLCMVDHCILFNDTDDHAIEAIRNVKMMYPNSQIVFANGGDRTEKNISEMSEPDVEFRFGVGGTDKKNSSSWILEEYKAPKTDRPWGYYRVVHEVSGTKVKELTINPGQSLTMQRHYDRDEHWHVAEGACTVDFEDSTTQSHIKLKKHDQFTIKAECWHKLHNPTDNPCKIVEIQYGIACVEEDIERR